MKNFMVSFFCQVLYRSIIATIIGVTILLLRKLLKKKISPKANYMIWMLFIISLLFPIAIPSKISIYNFIKVENVKYALEKENKTMIQNLEKLPIKTEFEQAKINYMHENNDKIEKTNFKKVVAYIWFVIFLLKIAKTALSYYFVMREIGNHELEDERIHLILERCKKRLKIRRKIKIIQQELFEMPSTIGIFDVKILVTDYFLESDNITLVDVFMHELSHYKRKDNIVNFILVVMKALHWFNPVLNEIFKVIRDDIEFATDETAISKMNKKEKIKYCRVMVEVSTMTSLDADAVLGLSNGVKYLESRIDRIYLKEKLEEHSKIIFAATACIMILMCLLLYPTSYGIYDIPKLYLKLENGDKIEAARINDENSLDLPEVRLSENSEVKLLTKNGKTYDYIFYNKMDSNNMKTQKDVFTISNGKIAYFYVGEYIYQFVLTNTKGENIDYAVKIIVE